jgi:hypothetical protein
MKVGDAVKIDFAGEKKDAVVLKLFPNSVHLKMDFARHKGKIIKRKLNAVGEKKAPAPKAGKVEKPAPKAKKEKSKTEKKK